MLGAANARSLQQKLQAAVKSGGTPGYPVFPNLSSLKESCTGEMMVGPRDRRPSAHVSSKLLSTRGPVCCGLSKKGTHSQRC